MRLLLIRHGQTHQNVAGALDTAHPGSNLTTLGVSQAHALPDALAEETITAVYASTRVRTQSTAAPLAAGLNVHVKVWVGLEEISAGRLELRSDVQAIRTYRDCTVSWMSGDLDVEMPGGPSGLEFYERYDAAISGNRG